MQTLFITILITSMVYSAIAYVLYNIFILRPIKKLINLSTQISCGDYKKRIDVTYQDEIGQLENSFNLMADRLEETINDLDDKKEKLSSILNCIDDGVILVDNSSKILIINPAAKCIFSINEDVIGKYFIEAIRNYDIEEIVKNMNEDDYEVNITYPEYKNLRIKTTKVIGKNVTEENISLLVFIQDITKINQLEKMRSDFVANVSHELKSPLTSIKGFVETLKYVEDKETRDKFLDIIYEESERLTRLISDILTLSELENKEININFEKVDVNKCVEDILYIMKPIANNKHIDVIYEKKFENDMYIYGDRDKFKQMLINLIDNGIKYTNEGGYVKVVVLKQNNYANIMISDNGIGIPNKYIPRLFERFYRVDKARSRQQGGTGLGLAIVKHILVLFKGDISVKSKIGYGTDFIINIPLVNN